MNIFFLDGNPEIAARMQCDQHVIKMPIESMQMLSAAFHANNQLDNPSLYAPSYLNHPSTVWVRQSRSHYRWLYRLMVALCEEYEYRYGREHRVLRFAPDFKEPPRAIVETDFSVPPLCMPDEYKIGSTVIAYRLFYLYDKVRFARWTRRSPPDWWHDKETLPDILRQKRIKEN